MKVKLVLLVLILSTSCHSGLLPCPHAKGPRMKKTHANKPLRQFMASLSAQANSKPENDINNIHYKSSKDGGMSAVENVSVEEWDCPHPGAKRYMPKSVKENIKKNFKKINTDQQVKTDSLTKR